MRAALACCAGAMHSTIVIASITCTTLGTAAQPCNSAFGVCGALANRNSVAGRLSRPEPNDGFGDDQQEKETT